MIMVINRHRAYKPLIIRHFLRILVFMIYIMSTYTTRFDFVGLCIFLRAVVAEISFDIFMLIVFYNNVLQVHFICC